MNAFGECHRLHPSDKKDIEKYTSVDFEKLNGFPIQETPRVCLDYAKNLDANGFFSDDTCKKLCTLDYNALVLHTNDVNNLGLQACYEGDASCSINRDSVLNVGESFCLLEK